MLHRAGQIDRGSLWVGIKGHLAFERQIISKKWCSEEVLGMKYPSLVDF